MCCWSHVFVACRARSISLSISNSAFSARASQLGQRRSWFLILSWTDGQSSWQLRQRMGGTLSEGGQKKTRGVDGPPVFFVSSAVSPPKGSPLTSELDGLCLHPQTG
jgi:hypothetical protein